MKLSSDLVWAKRTGGRLSGMHAATYIWRMLRLQVRSRAPASRMAMEFADEMIGLPDSSIVVAALAECRDTCPEAITSHCLRTFAWGCVIAAGRNLKVDREMFAVASLLHDLEIGRTGERLATGCRCFACAGAVRAEAFVIAHGRDQDWARRVGDAISLHLDPIVLPSQGIEAHVLQAGAALDVIGAGLSQIPLAARANVLAAHPRNGFKAELVRAMDREAAHGGGTRAAFIMSRGFARRIRQAPLD